MFTCIVPKLSVEALLCPLILTICLACLSASAEPSPAEEAAATLSGHTWICTKGGMTYGRSGKWRGCPCHEAKLVIQGSGIVQESCGANALESSTWSIATSESADNILTIDDPGTHRQKSYQLQFFAADKHIMHIVEFANGLTDEERYFDYTRVPEKP